MKIIASFLVLSLLALATVHGADDAPPMFPTDKEAVDHYAKAFMDQKPKSSQKFVEIIGRDLSDHNADDNTKTLVTTLDSVFEKSGNLRSADVMRVLKYGPSVRHAGYLLTYEHTVIVFDVWFFETPKGWQMVTYNVIANADPTQTLTAIPVEFGTPMDGY